MNFIRRFLLDRRRKKSGLKFNKDDVFKSRPVRNNLIKWEEQPETKLISLTVPQKEILWVKLISKAFMLPRSRVIVLDEVGSFVWNLCDGYNNIDTIDKCTNGKCVYEEKQTPETGGRNETSSRVECTTNTECNDNNNCTKDSCVNGICYNEKTCEESNNNFSIPITIGTLLIVSIIILGIIYYRTKPKKKTKH